MKCKHPNAVRPEPIGNLCVVREDNLTDWAVLICPGLIGERQPLARFSTRSEAEAFAQQHLVKLNAEQKDKKFILHVDDCPCWQKEL